MVSIECVTVEVTDPAAADAFYTWLGPRSPVSLSRVPCRGGCSRVDGLNLPTNRALDVIYGSVHALW
jgi:hypothetical protein